MREENQRTKSGNGVVSRPVFVVGVIRSGTSLLYALLNLHPQVALMFECDVWDFPQTFAWMRFKRNWLKRQEFVNRALSRHRLIFGGSLRGLENIRTPEHLYQTFSEGKANALTGEKSPFYCARLRWLARRYPECRFILIWRNPVDIYRSVVRAGRNEPFFRRRGILSRLIYYQEQMIRQAAELERAGTRLCHVTYDGLTDKPEETCRKICQYLEIAFDEKMLDLANADLSAVYPGPEHDNLRQGRIERRQTADQTELEINHPAALKLVQRFGIRWHRLQSKWLSDPAEAPDAPEPSAAERLYFKIAGAFFWAWDDGKRVLLEFLPLTWLRTYRQTKKWFLANSAELPVDQRSMGEQFRAHWITILTSAVFMAMVAYIDIITGPEVTLLPFYLVPCAALALIINHRWGTFAAATVMVIWSAIQADQNPNLSLEHWGTLLWDAGMRFVLIEIIVFLLNRIRVETTLATENA
jgi:hypothetical protein